MCIATSKRVLVYLSHVYLLKYHAMLYYEMSFLALSAGVSEPDVDVSMCLRSSNRMLITTYLLATDTCLCMNCAFCLNGDQACAWRSARAQTATHGLAGSDGSVGPVGPVSNDSYFYLLILPRPNPVAPYVRRAGELSVRTSHWVSANC